MKYLHDLLQWMVQMIPGTQSGDAGSCLQKNGNGRIGNLSVSGAIFRVLFFSGCVPVAAGIFLLFRSQELLQLFNGATWDAHCYYLEKLCFFGRLGIVSGLLWWMALLLLRKGWSLTKTAFTIALLVGSWLQIDSYCTRDLWHDTMALAVWLKYSTWKELLISASASPYCQSAPSGFLIFSKLLGEWTGFSKWSLTFLPLLFGLGALFNFMRLADRVLPAAAAAVTFWLFALNPGLLFYAGEFKQYTADIFFSVTLLGVAIEFAESENSSILKPVIWGIVSLLFSHAMFFVLPAVGFSLWAQKGFVFRKNLFRLLVIWAAGVLTAALYTKLMMPPGMYVHEHHTAGFAPMPVSFSAFKWYFNTIIDLFSAPWSMVWKISACAVFPLVGIIYGFRTLWKKQKVICLSSLVILLLLFLASVLHQYSLAAGFPFAKGRLILFTIPFAILIFGGSITGKWALSWIVPVVLAAVLNICTSFMPFGNFSPAVQDLISRSKPDEKILVNGTARLALLIYAPEGYFKNVQDMDEKMSVKISPDVLVSHIFIVDQPAEKLVIPAEYLVVDRKNFTFSTVMTLKKR